MDELVDTRPVNLDLTSIRFPITALVSISHRASGMALFFCLPGVLWCLEQALKDEAGFNQVAHHLHTPFGRVILMTALSSLWVHLIAGLRHLLMDYGVADGRHSGPLGAKCVATLGFLGISFIGFKIWW